MGIMGPIHSASRPISPTALMSRYHYENARMGHLPKHWSAEEEKVCIWQPFLVDTPHSLNKFLGTYAFVSMWDEDRPEYRLGTETTDNPGFLKLGLQRGAEPSWENVQGFFQTMNDWRRGAFSGLVPYQLSEAQAGGQVDPRPNLRRFDLITSYLNHVPLKGHAMDVLDAVDDNGNNYIVMMLEYCVSGSDCVSYMAKKQLDDTSRVGLTESERRKLGISLTFEEVEALGKGEVAP
ncbi:hypothetical protein C8R43DRAFT_639948 [Mycena crocata]|nr:hypothetical protein C8R43DRAFT_639948 [Mycena crocata]